jgi:hypothetical protein
MPCRHTLHNVSSNCVYYTEWTRTARPNLHKANLHHTTRKKYHVNTGLLKHVFRITFLKIKTKCSKCPPWVSSEALQETDFWDRTSFNHVWVALFTTISYETSFQSCWKMWICRLGFIYGCSTKFSFCTSGILERVSRTKDSTRRTSSMACSFPYLNPPFFKWLRAPQ